MLNIRSTTPLIRLCSVTALYCGPIRRDPEGIFFPKDARCQIGYLTELPVNTAEEKTYKNLHKNQAPCCTFTLAGIVDFLPSVLVHTKYIACKENDLVSNPSSTGLSGCQHLASGGVHLYPLKPYEVQYHVQYSRPMEAWAGR